MRRLVILLAISVFVISTSAFAGGAGNCVRPVKTTTKHIGVGGAFEYNYVHDRVRDLENNKGPKDMKVTNLSQIYGKGILGMGENVNVYGKAGACDYDLEFVDRAQDADMSIELDSGIYTGAGANALFPICEWKDISFGVGLDVQGNFFLNDVKGITRSGQVGLNPSGRFYGVDGQNSLYLTGTYEIEKLRTSLVPYIGGYHSWMVVGTQNGLSYTTLAAGNIDKEHYQGAFDFLSFGLLLGIDVDIAEYVNLNVEGRLIGETAITTGATIKF